MFFIYLVHVLCFGPEMLSIYMEGGRYVSFEGFDCIRDHLVQIVVQS